MIKREKYFIKGTIYLETIRKEGKITFFRKNNGRFICAVIEKECSKKLIYSQHAIQRDFDLISKITRNEGLQGDQTQQKGVNEIEIMYFSRLENQMIKAKNISI